MKEETARITLDFRKCSGKQSPPSSLTFSFFSESIIEQAAALLHCGLNLIAKFRNVRVPPTVANGEARFFAVTFGEQDSSKRST